MNKKIYKKLYERYIEEWNINDDEFFEIIKGHIERDIDFDKIKKEILLGRKLNIKFGIDPTSSKLHLGHIVPIIILKAFLKRGHNIMIVIGDFTARIGDPSGRSKERKVLGDTEIIENFKYYKEQLGMFIDTEKINILFNSSWINDLTYKELFNYFQNVSLAKAIDRNDFKERLKEGRRVSLAEVCYGTFMGIDSIYLKSDLEVGGIDQLLNFIQSRELMKNKTRNPEAVIMTPIIEGISNDGNKMSKSLGNTIDLLDSDKEIFRKIMKIKDQYIIKYFKVFSFLYDCEILELDKMLGYNPYELKKDLATYIISIKNKNIETGEAVRADYERLNKNEYNEEDFIKIKKIEKETYLELLCRIDINMTNSQIRRLFKQGSIRTIDKKKIIDMDDEALKIDIRVGKRIFIRII